MEVIYTGLHQTPEQIVETAIQEDADAIGLSVLSGAHMTLFQKLLALLEERQATDIAVFGGGIIPNDDIPLLTEAGVAKVFTPGATTYEIVDWVNKNLGGEDSDSHGDSGSHVEAASDPHVDSGSHVEAASETT